MSRGPKWAGSHDLGLFVTEQLCPKGSVWCIIWSRVSAHGSCFNIMSSRRNSSDVCAVSAKHRLLIESVLLTSFREAYEGSHRWSRQALLSQTMFWQVLFLGMVGDVLVAWKKARAS